MNLLQGLSLLGTVQIQLSNMSPREQYIPEIEKCLRTGNAAKVIIKGEDLITHFRWSPIIMSGAITVEIIPQAQEQGPPSPFLPQDPTLIQTLLRLGEVFRDYGTNLEAQWQALYEETLLDTIDARRQRLDLEYRMGWKGHGNLLYQEIQKKLYTASRGLAEFYEGILAALTTYDDLDMHSANNPRTLIPLLHRTADIMVHEWMKIPSNDGGSTQNFELYLLRKAVTQIIMGLRTLQVLTNAPEEQPDKAMGLAAQVAFQFTEIRIGIYAIVFGLRTHFGIHGSCWDALE